MADTKSIPHEYSSDNLAILERSITMAEVPDVLNLCRLIEHAQLSRLYMGDTRALLIKNPDNTHVITEGYSGEVDERSLAAEAITQVGPSFAAQLYFH